MLLYNRKKGKKENIMEGKKHKSKKIKTKVISGITIVMLILGISIFYRKETKTNINIQGQSIHTYTGTHTETDDTQYTYNIIYEYKDSNDDSIYEYFQEWYQMDGQK